jgi:uncharacterized membrane protein
MKSSELLRAELWISYLLRYGVLLCLFVIGTGLGARLVLGGSDAVVATLTAGQASADYCPHATPGALLGGVARFEPDTVIEFGVVLLILLPILRVAFTSLLFLRERDWAFAFLTLAVLGILLTGLLFGKSL